ncbi:MAG: hypothetical protein COZ12_00080 [Deltaproteobacteria bacterium CG_4_10_14_3_um_filter_60_8]|nr:MAG: hypothetical protein COZ12_00080 [Deltaproteobacteria bacterium CG_4_10_14_3_um_filter_60_8]
MKKTQRGYGWILLFGMVAAVLIFPVRSFAHCDTLDGPVVKTARAALEKGEATPLLKWVRAADELEIKEAFRKTLAVRAKGAEARDLADMYFFETLVRIHRAGEGAPYTGLKPGAEVDPAVALDDQALEDGNIDKLVDVLTNAMGKGIRERFHRASETRKHADDSVTAGREFVEAYIVFTHYVEGLHGMIKAGAAHHGEDGDQAAGHGHE